MSASKPGPAVIVDCALRSTLSIRGIVWPRCADGCKRPRAGSRGRSRRRLRLENRLAGAAARLDSLSPLAVLGRGYAVCWNDERTRVLRAATDTAPGETVRVRLETGELRCDVRDIITDHATDPKGPAP